MRTSKNCFPDWQAAPRLHGRAARGACDQPLKTSILFWQHIEEVLTFYSERKCWFLEVPPMIPRRGISTGKRMKTRKLTI